MHFLIPFQCCLNIKSQQVTKRFPHGGKHIWKVGFDDLLAHIFLKFFRSWFPFKSATWKWPQNHSQNSFWANMHNIGVFLNPLNYWWFDQNHWSKFTVWIIYIRRGIRLLGKSEHSLNSKISLYKTIKICNNWTMYFLRKFFGWEKSHNIWKCSDFWAGSHYILLVNTSISKLLSQLCPITSMLCYLGDSGSCQCWNANAPCCGQLWTPR